MLESTDMTCSVFKRELDALIERGEINLPVRYVDSVLHLEPRQLQAELDRVIADERECGRKVVLVYGDCHAYMLDDSNRPGVVRAEGVNCCEILIGGTLFRSYRRQGAFFLLPEWTTRWREVLPIALGPNDKEAWSMMREAHTKLMYLDTGLIEVPHDTLADISSYAGLPYEILEVSLEHLRNRITACVERLADHDA